MDDVGDVEERYWDSFCPRKNVNIVAARITAQNQRVDVGSFVELHAKDSGGRRKVVRILNRDRTSSPRDGMKWICCIYDRFINSVHQGHEKEVVVGLAANIPELYQTDKTISVFGKQMRSLAFVFHLDELREKAACLHGVDNGYFVRFRCRTRVIRVGPVTSIPKKDWFSYPCDSEYYKLPQSYVKTVFVCLEYIKSLFGRAGNRYSDTQGQYPRSRFSDILFPAEVWNYIKSRSFQLGEEIVVDEKQKKRKVSRLVTNVSISSVSFGVLENLEVIKFNTENGLSVVEKIFGVGSIWGFRHRRPKYNERKIATKMDTVNAVFGEDCYVELTYNTTANRLKMAVQYESFLFDFDEDGNLIDCPCPHFESYCSTFGPDNANSTRTSVFVGALFRRCGRTYEIQSVNVQATGESKITARVTDGLDKDEIHEFENEVENIGARVIAYYN